RGRAVGDRAGQRGEDRGGRVARHGAGASPGEAERRGPLPDLAADGAAVVRRGGRGEGRGGGGSGLRSDETRHLHKGRGRGVPPRTGRKGTVRSARFGPARSVSLLCASGG